MIREQTKWMVTAAAFLAVLLACIPVTAQEAQLPSVELPPSLARVLSDYEAAWQNKDAAALAALFTEDGFVLAGGTVGYIIGAYTRRKGEADVGKFTLTLHRSADSRWLIMSDMDNGSSRP